MKALQGALLAASVACLFAVAARADEGAPGANRWIEVGAAGGVTHYVAPAALIHQDEYAVIWRLKNYQQARVINKKPVGSIKYQVEYNCSSHQRRGLYFEMYSGQMGTGKLIALSYDRDDWRSLPLNASTDAYQLACSAANAAKPALIASAP